MTKSVPDPEPTSVDRCPACLTTLKPGDATVQCSLEHVAVHIECVEMLKRCPTIGCDLPLDRVGIFESTENQAIQVTNESLKDLKELNSQWQAEYGAARRGRIESSSLMTRLMQLTACLVIGVGAWLLMTDAKIEKKHIQKRQAKVARYQSSEFSKKGRQEYRAKTLEIYFTTLISARPMRVKLESYSLKELQTALKKFLPRGKTPGLRQFGLRLDPKKGIDRQIVLALVSMNELPDQQNSARAIVLSHFHWAKLSPEQRQMILSNSEGQSQKYVIASFLSFNKMTSETFTCFSELAQNPSVSGAELNWCIKSIKHWELQSVTNYFRLRRTTAQRLQASEYSNSATDSMSYSIATWGAAKALQKSELIDELVRSSDSDSKTSVVLLEKLTQYTDQTYLQAFCSSCVQYKHIPDFVQFSRRKIKRAILNHKGAETILKILAQKAATQQNLRENLLQYCQQNQIRFSGFYRELLTSLELSRAKFKLTEILKVYEQALDTGAFDAEVLAQKLKAISYHNDKDLSELSRLFNEPELSQVLLFMCSDKNHGFIVSELRQPILNNCGLWISEQAPKSTRFWQLFYDLTDELQEFSILEEAQFRVVLERHLQSKPELQAQALELLVKTTSSFRGLFGGQIAKLCQSKSQRIRTRAFAALPAPEKLSKEVLLTLGQGLNQQSLDYDVLYLQYMHRHGILKSRQLIKSIAQRAREESRADRLINILEIMLSFPKLRTNATTELTGLSLNQNHSQNLVALRALMRNQPSESLVRARLRDGEAYQVEVLQSWPGNLRKLLGNAQFWRFLRKSSAAVRSHCYKFIDRLTESQFLELITMVSDGQQQYDESTLKLLGDHLQYFPMHRSEYLKKLSPVALRHISEDQQSRSAAVSLLRKLSPLKSSTVKEVVRRFLSVMDKMEGQRRDNVLHLHAQTMRLVSNWAFSRQFSYLLKSNESAQTALAYLPANVVTDKKVLTAVFASYDLRKESHQRSLARISQRFPQLICQEALKTLTKTRYSREIDVASYCYLRALETLPRDTDLFPVAEKALKALKRTELTSDNFYLRARFVLDLVSRSESKELNNLVWQFLYYYRPIPEVGKGAVTLAALLRFDSNLSAEQVRDLIEVHKSASIKVRLRLFELFVLRRQLGLKPAQLFASALKQWKNDFSQSGYALQCARYEAHLQQTIRVLGG